MPSCTAGSSSMTATVHAGALVGSRAWAAGGASSSKRQDIVSSVMSDSANETVRKGSTNSSLGATKRKPDLERGAAAPLPIATEPPTEAAGHQVVNDVQAKPGAAARCAGS